MVLCLLSQVALAAPAAVAPSAQRGLVLPALPAPRLHPELARPALAVSAPARTWAPVELLPAPSLGSLLGGSVAVSARSWTQEVSARQSVLPGAWAASVLEPPSFPERAP